MASSETQKRVIDLGKTLVEELNSESRIDTPARWMAHYIAEQMVIAEEATGDDKVQAEQRCFETILKLWQHRWSFPTGKRPFERFEPIFRALEQLDPDNSTPYFYKPNPRSSDMEETDEDASAIRNWLEAAQAIDEAARVWLEYVFQQAALTATDARTTELLKNAVGLPASDDVSIIVQLLLTDLTEETAEQRQQGRREELESRLKQLDAFVEFNQLLYKGFAAELEAISRNDSTE